MLGQPVLARLINDGYDVKVLTHNIEQANKLFKGQVPLYPGDVTDIKTLKKPMEGIDAVYINLSAKMNISNYERVEAQGTANLANVAKEQGVGQIAMISGLSVTDETSKYLFLKAKAKAENALKDCGVPYTIMRCGWFFESLPLFVTGKQATVFGKQPHKYSWMAAADYTGMVSKIFELEEARNRTFLIKGIDTHTIGDALEGFCNICHPDVKLVKIPLWTVSFLSTFSGRGAMRGVAKFMKYFNNHEEIDTLDVSDKILGPALTTLKDWSENYKIRMMAK